MRQWTLAFPQPTRLLSMNDRLHFRVEGPRIRCWRGEAMLAALTQHAGLADDLALALVYRRQQMKQPIPTDVVPPLPACTVQVVLPVADRRPRDPHNYFKTVKPIIDGLVDAGLWPNDTPDWVTTIEPRLVVKSPKVIVHLTERTT